jgi:hypothetical protein
MPSFPEEGGEQNMPYRDSQYERYQHTGQRRLSLQVLSTYQPQYAWLVQDPLFIRQSQPMSHNFHTLPESSLPGKSDAFINGFSMESLAQSPVLNPTVSAFVRQPNNQIANQVQMLVSNIPIQNGLQTNMPFPSWTWPHNQQ